MNTFEFADRFGYEPPFEIKEDKIEHVDGNSTNVKNVIVRTGIKFVYSTKAYEDAFGLPLQYPNYILIFAKKPRELKIIKDKRTVSRLSHSGITFKDIINIYGITLGKNLVIAIEKDKNKAKEIANHVLKWLEISERTHSNFYRILVEMISNFVIAHPSKSYKQITSFDEFMNLLSLCIQLGVIDISNMAGFISDEIFAAFAKKIRETKLTEERWNPNIANIKYYPNIKSGKEYNPLIPSLDKLTSTVSLFFNEGKNQSFTNEIKTQQGLSKKQLETISLINSKSIFVIKQLYDEFGKFLISSLENTNEYLKLNNAFIVGLINGIIELIATIVEAMGFVIGLLNYDKVTKLGESIKQAIAQLEWKTIKTTIKNELQKLFSFLDDDNNYKNIYEFGLFIPKIIELILDTIGLVKGASKVAKSVADIATELVEALKKANKALNDLKIHLALKIISKDLLQELKQKGITLEVRLIPASNLNAGIPIKMFDGKKIKVKYRNVILEVFDNEKDANNFLKKLESDTVFFKKKIQKYIQKRKLEMKPPYFSDVRRNGNAYRDHEIDSFIDLEIKFHGQSRASKSNEAGDIIMETGLLKGQSIDPLGLSIKSINPWKNNFNYNFEKFKISIERHFEKIISPKNGLPALDKVVIDFKFMNQIDVNLQQKVLNYIESPTFEYKQYVNEKYLIKLNLK